MKEVLRKRVLRELKSDWVRYLALFILIMACMYLVISIVGSADTIIEGTYRSAEKQNVEDGYFTIFTKLTEEQIKDIENQDVSIEEHFSIDIMLEDEDLLRAFSNREKLDLLCVDEGKKPEHNNEVALEKRYCEENDIQVGQSISISGADYNVCGIVTTPDYENVLKTLADTSVNSKIFGTAFFTEEEYKNLVKRGAGYKAEEYLYAFSLNGEMDADELKKLIQDFPFEADEIEDESFQEYWSHTGGKMDDIKDGLDELEEGGIELTDGLKALEDGSNELTNGLFDIDFASSFIDAPKEYKDGVSKIHKGSETLTEKLGKAVEGSKKLNDGIGEFRDHAETIIDEYMNAYISNLSSFVKAEDNTRIHAAANDVIINKQAGLFVGVIIMALFAYVISVFVINNINKECSIIGALYALGAKRKDIIGHYLTLPVLVCFLSGLVGTLVAFSPMGIASQMGDTYGYFSLPKLSIPVIYYLLVYGVIMPPLVAYLVNYFVIRKKLSSSALSLIRNEQKQGKTGRLKLPHNMKYETKFQIRQMLNEIRTSLAVVFGMFISLILVMLSLNVYVMCTHYKEDSVNDTKFAYMYTIKYPKEEAPKDGISCYSKILKSPERYGYSFDTVVIGTQNSNPFFDLKMEKGKNKITISSAMQSKYNLEVGDTLILTDEETNQMYAFEISGVTQYSAGMFCFMPIEDARELFDASEDEYNLVFADHDLEIESGILFSTLSKEDVERGASVFIDQMSGMVILLLVMSAIVFVSVLYLMLDVMINRSKFNISLIKVFGYKAKDIKKLYLNGTLYVITVGAIVSIPLAKFVMDKVYPYLVSNVACDTNLTFPIWLYFVIFIAIMILSMLIMKLLVGKINKLLPADVLKNRE